MSWREARRQRRREQQRAWEVYERGLARSPDEVARDHAGYELEPLRIQFPLVVQERLVDVQLGLRAAGPEEQHSWFAAGLAAGADIELDEAFEVAHATIAGGWSDSAACGADPDDRTALMTALFMALAQGHGLGLALTGNADYPYWAEDTDDSWAEDTGDEDADPAQVGLQILKRLTLLEAGMVLDTYGPPMAGAVEDLVQDLLMTFATSRSVDLREYRPQLVLAVLTGIGSGIVDCELQQGVFDPDRSARIQANPAFRFLKDNLS